MSINSKCIYLVVGLLLSCGEQSTITRKKSDLSPSVADEASKSSGQGDATASDAASQNNTPVAVKDGAEGTSNAPTEAIIAPFPDPIANAPSEVMVDGVPRGMVEMVQEDAAGTAPMPQGDKYNISYWVDVPSAYKKQVKITHKNKSAPKINVKQTKPIDHAMGLKLMTGKGVKHIKLDVGVYSSFNFKGTKGSDTLEMGPQGTIISKRRGGTIDFQKDNAPDRFIFTNTINVAKCSAKHPELKGGCHKLNHLQKVTIKNFGKEDTVILQGKTYKFEDIQGNAFKGVPIDRLRVEKQ